MIIKVTNLHSSYAGQINLQLTKLSLVLEVNFCTINCANYINMRCLNAKVSKGNCKRASTGSYALAINKRRVIT